MPAGARRWRRSRPPACRAGSTPSPKPPGAGSTRWASARSPAAGAACRATTAASRRSWLASPRRRISMPWPTCRWRCRRATTCWPCGRRRWTRRRWRWAMRWAHTSTRATARRGARRRGWPCRPASTRSRCGARWRPARWCATWSTRRPRTSGRRNSPMRCARLPRRAAPACASGSATNCWKRISRRSTPSAAPRTVRRG